MAIDLPDGWDVQVERAYAVFGLEQRALEQGLSEEDGTMRASVDGPGEFASRRVTPAMRAAWARMRRRGKGRGGGQWMPNRVARIPVVVPPGDLGPIDEEEEVPLEGLPPAALLSDTQPDLEAQVLRAYTVFGVNPTDTELGWRGFPDLDVDFLRRKAKAQLRDAVGRWRDMRGTLAGDEPLDARGRVDWEAAAPARPKIFRATPKKVKSVAETIAQTEPYIQEAKAVQEERRKVIQELNPDLQDAALDAVLEKDPEWVRAGKSLKGADFQRFLAERKEKQEARDAAQSVEAEKFESEAAEIVPTLQFQGDINQAAYDANPRWFDGYEYQINCQRVASAVELRTRGYDVTAGPNTRTVDAYDLSRVWKEQDGSVRRFQNFLTYEQVVEIVQGWGSNTRGFVGVSWIRGKRGHLFNVANIGGEVVLVEGQTPDGGILGDWERDERVSQVAPGTWSVMRADDLEPNIPMMLLLGILEREE